MPIRDYEALKPYVDRVVSGELNVLWEGNHIYFAKTSGTTSGVKYIPITKASMPTHIEAARNAILLYIAETRKTNFVNGKMIFLQGSPILNTNLKMELSLAVFQELYAHYVPKYISEK